ncbi:hypothetical protein SPRG_03155 [Saprolegnia parasitica CBS 223.65]|uniref:subtilisin n=1 Tax=Saprolegnia parasitica (strain CBS 223.65) TaxID=695850 RepID=A0A067CMK9_SAPPC|nr:hypothetical protein SPRG_03155 [Saprolegnia parasitica CBS 223.65]KDO31939.1 hypothetical protein SPRG_03155 [Saprolegnia parasitica CBS 223.65]|eukprot:XP_012197137.1 hypothetical protein SPRG_03155 [Saprolegnia parasitica CBS 223.65]
MVRVVLPLLTVAACSVAADQTKIHPRLLRELAVAAGANIVVEFKGRADEVLAKAGPESTTSLAEHVYSTLQAHADVSQAAALHILRNDKLESASTLKPTSLWITNSLYIPGATQAVADALAKLPEVLAVRHEDVLTLDLPTVVDAATNVTAEWGVAKTQAPLVWAEGFTGAGVVVGSIDTGVRGTHEALRSNFRALHGWYDPTAQLAEPSDTHGHGSHTLGSAVGGLGVGVAPDAKWIACRGCPGGSCPESALVACAQFMVCPTDVHGANPRCDLKPHVVTNSWGSTVDWPFKKAIVDAWRAAGILPVFSIGNSGPSCSSVGYPGGYANVIGVGATDDADALGYFSSKGPTADGRMKPDLSAPGVRVTSCGATGDAAYVSMSGTSMAAPHVAGAIALLISAKPGISYDEVYMLLTTTAETKSLANDASTCGGLPGTAYPNNNFGHGRLDILGAIEKLVAKPAC